MSKKKEKNDTNWQIILKHPLIILLIGAVLSSLVLPVINDQIENQNLERNQRNTIAVEVFNHDATVAKHLNSLKSTMFFYLKNNWSQGASDHTIDPIQFSSKIEKAYEPFDNHAWYWIPQIISKSDVLGLITPEEKQKLYDLNDSYIDEITKALKFIDPIRDEIKRDSINLAYEKMIRFRSACDSSRNNRLKLVYQMNEIILDNN